MKRFYILPVRPCLPMQTPNTWHIIDREQDTWSPYASHPTRAAARQHARALNATFPDPDPDAGMWARL